MTKIFWVTCPQCKGEFYCHWQELRHKKIKLLCPYCSHQFLDEESSKIVEMVGRKHVIEKNDAREKIEDEESSKIVE